MRYNVAITETGKSEAIPLDQLFRKNPEFQQVKAPVVAPGYGDDTIVVKFLDFLENDLKSHPEQIKPLSETRIAQASKLTEGVWIDEDEFPDDMGL